ncbi:hypothetical protein [Methylobacterium haplocladii]|uniref:Uncharacterized protein n=1 Tax=Methylobacterium haplocladii TaxID=1176176 RepID=A0A512IKS6_9HYPH|nr:hypothetical protein [Methylobacterium haplocladii]GEO98242.1 hypothetical protein MHA02_06300 [Methylobacterium haplocladii]GJD84363.1 hypothetical protein HPGCJGGD_2239 [Methylobacterium haplocladii]GLS60538.1 hypothetical protein GCM10007887_32170 [Methylobacterium haplocladii]
MGNVPFQALPTRVADASLPYLLGSGLLLASTALFVWQAPVRNGPAAMALAIAIALEAASRLAAEAVSRRSGVELAMRGLPSLVLPLGAMPGLAVLVLALLPLLGPGRFPVVATLLAGMIAMGALARFSLTRSVLVLAKAEPPAPPAQA